MSRETIATETVTVVSTTEPRAQDNTFKLSATRLQMYRTCPRQYRYAYLEKIPTVLTGPLAFGKAIHQALHHLYTRSILSGEPMSAPLAYHDFARLWHQIIAEHDPLFAGGNKEIEEYSRLAGHILDKYVESQKNDVAAGEAIPLVMEHPFEIAWHDPVSGRQYPLCGVIDRIDQGENGLIVVDYKTGKRKPTPHSLHSDLQLILYAHAAQTVFGQPVEQVVLYHLRSNGTFCAQYDRTAFGYLLQEVVPAVIRGIQTQKFGPRYGFWCNYCEYQQLCQAEGDAASGSRPVSLHRAVPAEAAILRSQHRAIHILQGQVSMSEEQLSQLLQIRFGTPKLEELTKRQAAHLLTELQHKLQRAGSTATTIEEISS